MKVKIKPLSSKIGKEIPFPFYATAGAGAMDLHACLDSTVLIAPGERAMIPTGIAISLPSAEYLALIFARSGVACKFGVAPANCVGVIDSDYRGEIMVCLQNNGQDAFSVALGDRIAQMAIMPVFQAEIEIADDLDQTSRGSGGFGSTGR